MKGGENSVETVGKGVVAEIEWVGWFETQVWKGNMEWSTDVEGGTGLEKQVLKGKTDSLKMTSLEKN